MKSEFILSKHTIPVWQSWKGLVAWPSFDTTKPRRLLLSELEAKTHILKIRNKHLIIIFYSNLKISISHGFGAR